MSLASANQKAYGCGFENTEAITDPHRNIQCAIKIMSYWVDRDRRLGGGSIGIGRYCAVLRTDKSYRRASYHLIKQRTSNYCQSQQGTQSLADQSQWVGS